MRSKRAGRPLAYAEIFRRAHVSLTAAVSAGTHLSPSLHGSQWLPGHRCKDKELMPCSQMGKRLRKAEEIKEKGTESVGHRLKRPKLRAQNQGQFFLKY